VKKGGEKARGGGGTPLRKECLDILVRGGKRVRLRSIRSLLSVLKGSLIIVEGRKNSLTKEGKGITTEKGEADTHY